MYNAVIDSISVFDFHFFLLFFQFLNSGCVQFKRLGIVFSLILSTKFITIHLCTMIIKNTNINLNLCAKMSFNYKINLKHYM